MREGRLSGHDRTQQIEVTQMMLMILQSVSFSFICQFFVFFSLFSVHKIIFERNSSIIFYRA